MRRPPSSSSTVEWPTQVARTPAVPEGPPAGCCATAPRYSGENGAPCPPPPPPLPPPPRCCRPCRSGATSCESPVVLAPMAGITNRAFRRLCREYGTAGLEAGGASGATSLYVSEMVTTRALVERTPETMRLISHDPDENPRSVQLYSVDPVTAGLAARILVTEDRADHIDLNFGCPVPKVTRKGGGAALPWKTDLFRGIVARRRARGVAVRRAGHREDAGRHRRRPRHLPGCRADRRGRGRGGGRAARAHRRPGVLGAGRLVGDRPAQGGRDVDPGARQRRHLVGRGRPGDGAADRLRRGGRGARLPRAAVAVHRPRRGVRRVARARAARAAAR